MSTKNTNSKKSENSFSKLPEIPYPTVPYPQAPSPTEAYSLKIPISKSQTLFDRYFRTKERKALLLDAVQEDPKTYDADIEVILKKHETEADKLSTKEILALRNAVFTFFEGIKQKEAPRVETPEPPKQKPSTGTIEIDGQVFKPFWWL